MEDREGVELVRARMGDDYPRDRRTSGLADLCDKLFGDGRSELRVHHGDFLPIVVPDRMGVEAGGVGGKDMQLTSLGRGSGGENGCGSDN